jgi:CRISPR-associated protein (TIGR03986 family)
MCLIDGVLKLRGRELRVEFQDSTGVRRVLGGVERDQLSWPLMQLCGNNLPQLDGFQVQFRLNNGRAQSIRPHGERFERVPPPAGGPLGANVHAPTQRQNAQPAAQANRALGPMPPIANPAFHNPYNFVPALPRDNIQGDLGDACPVGHHVLHGDRYTGVVRMKMTVETPLLLPDAAKKTPLGQDHWSFPVRVDAQNNPYVPPTSVKGMLRAAYEAVTNSRLAVFKGHDHKLAYRMGTGEGLGLVPARVEGDEIVLLAGTSQIGAGRPIGPMYAAWLPRYINNPLRYPDGTMPQHGEHVQCWVEEVRRLNNRNGMALFTYWKVRSIARIRDGLGGQPNQGVNAGRHAPTGRFENISGFACVTNQNMDNKHDERVFFTTQRDLVRFQIKESDRNDWKTLIRNYQQEHERELRGGAEGPPALREAEWSRHINSSDPGELELKDGTLLYAQVRDVNGRWELAGLYPVNIARKLYKSSPSELLPKSLRPAETIDQLSPADRVFGWVNQNGKGGVKGSVRIGLVACTAQKPIEPFGNPGIALAILGQPKPQQARCYVASSPKGEAQPNGLPKDDVGYEPGKGLRGRKVYPHHRDLPQGHWNNPAQDRTQQDVNGHFQEYRRPQGVGDSQNRSIQGWVKPGITFEFDIHLTNLSTVELGALIWLLDLNKFGDPQTPRFHRLGGGKPLGFGSVRLEIVSSSLFSGDEWKEMYRGLEEPEANQQRAELLLTQSVGAYQSEVKKEYRTGFEQVPFIAAWLRACTGHPDGRPTHYPRKRQGGPAGQPVPPHPDGESFKWFVDNERTGQVNPGQGASLSNLSDDRGLPMY